MTPSHETNDFTALGAHPTLARALSQHRYDVPTPVQAAVLSAPDRDLLVSSQTGSGKTIAFGLLIGRTLLGDAAKLDLAVRPRALVIAPTRELAAQVQRELDWLFAETGARIGSFTGGTDLRLDARALKRGIDVAVGTPGRLVDLLARKSLDLSSLQVLVLDEADEMLDMGFRESLETILNAAPIERRTLLFSATLPSAIQTLARRYQKDAVALDPRAGAPAAHADIQHVAHLCAKGEVLAAVINVLRHNRDDRAMVFCRTRDDVAEFHRQLVARGILATAISGERVQAERNRSLEAIRQGRVRVLVATNVAARGIDLPDVGLVIHAELPDNTDELTHRSGRTGRAGKKGVNVFIVEPSDRQRAERLFAKAHLRLPWSAPPSAEAIAKRQAELFKERLRTEILAAADRPVGGATDLLTAELLAEHSADTIVAALLGRALAELPAGESLTPVAPPKKSAAREAPSNDSMELFQVNIGLKDRATANWILPLVCRRGDVTRREVGGIRVMRDRTYFEISTKAAARFSERAAERDKSAPHVRIERATDIATLPRSFSPPTTPRSSGPPRRDDQRGRPPHPAARRMSQRKPLR